MNGIKVIGEIPLNGEVKIQGSKNAALPMMAAALLNKGETILKGCPKIADVFAMEKILNRLGVKSHWEGHTLFLNTAQITGNQVDRVLERVCVALLCFLAVFWEAVGRPECLIPEAV